jgi:Tfp pilus assembly protein PilO
MSIVAKKTHSSLIVGLVILAIISLGIIVGGWYYILGLSGDGNRLDTEGDNYLAESAALSDLKLSLARISSQKEGIYLAIPRSKDISEFLTNFDNLAKNDGITITSTNIGDVKTKVKTGSDFSQTVNKSEYYELPIRYDVNGDYVNLTKLMSDIAIQKRLISVSDLMVTTNNTDSTQKGQVKGTFVVTIYAKK